MTKTELEEKIKNVESVWCLYQSHKEIELLHLCKESTYKFEEVNYISGGTELCLVINYDWYYPLEYLFKTKFEAEHYLNHADVERVEKLPFLTWEEFNEKKSFTFTTRNGNRIKMYIANNKIVIYKGFRNNKEYEKTEQGFYKAYDECKKLFLGQL